ncbi:hypothetical protein ADUPG1_013702 [Aduncisulcus paluster]|uniref:DUS-like FMN-binding domain-containing protein n=1 Tax=Aduncisulcus paluster TaxID=2918883 RepID=A0ABQ5K739_9EUKA|nr:hypothetical protein ADUPG1_013702 [Aduncisulcus paluster]
MTKTEVQPLISSDIKAEIEKEISYIKQYKDVGIDLRDRTTRRIISYIPPDPIPPATLKYPDKPSRFAWYNDVLKSPKTFLAPMVDGSDLPFRILTRRHGVECAFTPMYNSSVFATHPLQRIQVHPPPSDEYAKEDMNIIVQLCGNDPKKLVNSALVALSEDKFNRIAAFDINLGCPQRIARRGYFGSYLQDNWPLCFSLVRALHEALPVPVTVKIRVLSSLELTMRYVDMLVAAGAQMLTVHGRTREERNEKKTRTVNYEYIRAIVAKYGSVLPIVVNGAIDSFEKHSSVLKFTKAHATMAAEHILYDPSMYENAGIHGHDVWERVKREADRDAWEAVKEIGLPSQSSSSSPSLPDTVMLPLKRRSGESELLCTSDSAKESAKECPVAKEEAGERDRKDKKKKLLLGLDPSLYVHSPIKSSFSCDDEAYLLSLTQLATEFLDIASSCVTMPEWYKENHKQPINPGLTKTHLMPILEPHLARYTDLRDRLSNGRGMTLDIQRGIVKECERRIRERKGAVGNVVSAMRVRKREEKLRLAATSAKGEE